MPRVDGVTIGELSRRVGVSTDVLRAWERRYGMFHPERTDGGYRLYTPADERRARQVVVLRDRGMTTSDAVAEVSGYAARVRPAELDDAELRIDAIDATVRRFDEAGVVAALDQAIARLGIAVATRDVVMPYLTRLGNQWASGEVSVAHEHFASHLIRRRIAANGRQLAAEGRRTVVLACPPTERHDIGLLAYGVLLSNVGWSVRYLGADTPISDLVRACEAVDPDLVVLSATRPSVFRVHTGLIRMLGRRWRVGLAGAGATMSAAAETGTTLLPTDIIRAVDVADEIAAGRVATR